MNLIGAIEESFKKEMADFNVGDTVKVYVKLLREIRKGFSLFRGL